jgi:5'-deoxynucleotidase YfbR-like HD superfamily hydrolase
VMTTIRTYSGIQVPMLQPRPEHIALVDIARGLSMTARFNGHTRFFYSVAEHSVLVASLLRDWGHDRDVVLAGLMHDAAEAYLGDVTSPMKRALRQIEGRNVSSYDVMEITWMRAVAERFGLTQLEHSDVKRADLAMLDIENQAVRFLREAQWTSAELVPMGLPQLDAEHLFLGYARDLGLADA